MRVLITGENSYVGTHVMKELEEAGHQVEELEVRSDQYKEFDFSNFDSIVHVAAIVHQKNGQISDEEYYRVNSELPVDIASRAKEMGVKQFVFLSTMAVYGQNKELPHGNVIDENTPLKPVDIYGESKLIAERELAKIEDDNFRLAIVRPPSIYGLNCPGNYITKFVSLADNLPFLPEIYNDSKQGFLYIENLSIFIRLLIENQERGVYLPQDDRSISTLELLELLAEYRGKQKAKTTVFNPPIRLLEKNPLVIKLFGGISYDTNLDYFGNEYRKYSIVDAFKFVQEME